MATKQKSASVQESVSQSVNDVPSGTAIESGPSQAMLQEMATKAREEAQKARDELLGLLQFSDLIPLLLKSARWSDVIRAAKKFSENVQAAAKNSDGKATTIARKAAQLSQSHAMELRFALCSYALSGRGANPTQQAELASVLPELLDKGALRDRRVTFGGIVLPPLAGEL